MVENPLIGRSWVSNPPEELRQFDDGENRVLSDVSTLHKLLAKLHSFGEGGGSEPPGRFSKSAGIAYRTALENNQPGLALEAMTLWVGYLYDSGDNDWNSVSLFVFEFFGAVADVLASEGYAECAGWAYTSQAEALLRSTTLTDDDLTTAWDTVSRALKLRDPNTVDRYYTLYTMARLEMKKQMPLGSAEQKPPLKKLRRAYRQLKSQGRIPPIQRIVGLTEMLNAEIRIIRKRRDEVAATAVRSHRKELTIPFEVDDSELCEMLRSIPHELGLEGTPDWLPSWREMLDDLGERTSTARMDAEELESILNEEGVRRDSRDFRRARESIAELRWVMDPSPDTLSSYVAVLSCSGIAPDFAQLDVQLQLWIQARAFLPSADVHSLSLLILESYSAVRKSASSEESMQFHLRYPVELRFVAADFVRHGDLSSAVRILQYVQSDASGYPFTSIPVNHYRVYVFHDTERSFVISVSSDGNLCGRMTELSGKRLSAGWLSMFSDVPGATVAQYGVSSRESSTRFRDELLALDKLVEIIGSLVPEASAILLEPFGLYHHVPLASMIEYAKPASYFLIAEPRTSYAREKFPRRRFGAYSANSTERGVLPASDSECRSIASLVGEKYDAEVFSALTRPLLADALGKSAAVHICAHGEASNVYSFNSRLFLDDGVCTAEELMESGPFVSELVFLNACQSSANVAGFVPESGLSIAGVLANGGVGCVVGTTRNIMDTPAALLMARFYSIWDGDTSPYSVYPALAESQRWIRGASMEAIRDFNDSLSAPINLPESMSDDGASLPFSEASCWAPYCLTVSTAALAYRKQPDHPSPNGVNRLLRRMGRALSGILPGVP